MKITIIAKRWFQKTYGNTYHSCRVLVDGAEIGYCPYTYGYGEQYLDTALALLQSAGIVPKTDERLASGISKDIYDFRMDMRDNRDKYEVFCTDVNRKRDL